MDSKTVVWTKLVRAVTDGLSLFRPGCSEQQVKKAVQKLLSGGAEPQSLIGVALVSVADVRSSGGSVRWFCVYDTKSDEFKEHADIAMTNPDFTLSKTQSEKQSQIRMRDLRDRMSNNIIFATTADELILSLRSSGFEILDGAPENL